MPVRAASEAAGAAGKTNMSAQLAADAANAAAEAIVQPSIDLASAQAVKVGGRERSARLRQN